MQLPQPLKEALLKLLKGQTDLPIMLVDFVWCSQVIEVNKSPKGFHISRCISETRAPSAVNVTNLQDGSHQRLEQGFSTRARHLGKKGFESFRLRPLCPSSIVSAASTHWGHKTCLWFPPLPLTKCLLPLILRLLLGSPLTSPSPYSYSYSPFLLVWEVSGHNQSFHGWLLPLSFAVQDQVSFAVLNRYCLSYLTL